MVDVIEAAKSSPKIEVAHMAVREAKKVVLRLVLAEKLSGSVNLREGRFFKKDEPLLKIGIRQSNLT
ncbi:MAG: hypothetical protein CM1200mP30_18590 [Pseudomonadota bacterium]|nr:MAG: hypothetical protein CM1200mP30_18590 [Pseudomonadota bacterium]